MQEGKLTGITDESQIVISSRFLKIIGGILSTALITLCSIFWYFYQDIKDDNEKIQISLHISYYKS